MPTPDPDPELTPSAELFARFLEGRAQGRPADFEEFCAGHPEHAVELRKLERHWRTIDSALGGAAEATGPASSDRYELGDEVGRGGMGVVMHAYDRNLRRKVAMKFAEGHGGDARAHSRFLDEARITGQLEHPGIVPIYDLGTDPALRPYFTMPLLRGRTFREVIDAVHAGDAEWTLPRALGILLAVCDAVASAHAKGVIHRDLKPGNVIVGRFGETYVMDWGLARVLGETDVKDIRLREVVTGTSVVHASRRDLADSDPESPLITMDGDVVGTPAYMPPEQARGEVHRLGPRADVYAAGAMLYHVVAGSMPYAPKGARVSARTVLARVLDGPPRPLAELARRAPPELVAICAKAMAREPEDRYADMRELAADLRAFLELRVVSAYGGGAWTELRKWVRRNRFVAAAAAVTVFALAGGLALSLAAHGRARDAAGQAQAHFGLAVDAVNELVKIGSTELKDLPQTEPVRRHLFERALAFHLRFVGIKADDPDLAEQAAQTWRWVGDIHGRLGHLDEALAAGREAMRGLEAVLRAAPHRHDLESDLAWTENEVAGVFETRGDWEQALAHYRHVAERLEHLTGAHQDVADYRVRWLHALHNCTTVLNSQQKYADALPITELVLRERQALVERHPGEYRYVSHVAAAHAGRAFTLYKLQRTAEAAGEQRLAAESYDRLLGERPTDQELQDFAGLAWNQLGVYLRAQDPAQARCAAERSVELRRGLVRDHPQVPVYRSNLAGSLSNLSELRIAAGDDPGARLLLEEAIEHQRGVLQLVPGLDQARRYMWQHVRVLFRVLERQKDHVALAQRAAQLLDQPQLGEKEIKAWAGQQLAVCCKLVQADPALEPATRDQRVAELAHRSLELMHAAFDLGWRPNPAIAAFDGIRSHEGFVRFEAKVREAKQQNAETPPAK